MLLTGKKILVISPQDWSFLKLSKHHYAMELAKLDNEVFFLNPPKRFFEQRNSKIKSVGKGLNVVDFKWSFPLMIEKHIPYLYKLLLNRNIKKLKRLIGEIDIVWSFSSLFADLRVFGSELSVYHQVDNSHEPNYVATGDSADLIIGVTPEIVNRFKTKEAHLIEHGISSTFLDAAQGAKATAKTSNSIDFAYSGNLSIESLDKDLLMELISQRDDVNFHFFGSHNKEYPDFLRFYSFLQNRENVILHGQLSPEELAGHYQEMDGFLVCYDKRSSFAMGRIKLQIAIKYWSISVPER